MKRVAVFAWPRAGWRSRAPSGVGGRPRTGRGTRSSAAGPAGAIRAPGRAGWPTGRLIRRCPPCGGTAQLPAQSRPPGLPPHPPPIDRVLIRCGPVGPGRQDASAPARVPAPGGLRRAERSRAGRVERWAGTSSVPRGRIPYRHSPAAAHRPVPESTLCLNPARRVPRFPAAYVQGAYARLRQTDASATLPRASPHPNA